MRSILGVYLLGLSIDIIVARFAKLHILLVMRRINDYYL